MWTLCNYLHSTHPYAHVFRKWGHGIAEGRQLLGVAFSRYMVTSTPCKIFWITSEASDLKTKQKATGLVMVGTYLESRTGEDKMSMSQIEDQYQLHAETLSLKPNNNKRATGWASCRICYHSTCLLRLSTHGLSVNCPTLISCVWTLGPHHMWTLFWSVEALGSSQSLRVSLTVS